MSASGTLAVDVLITNHDYARFLPMAIESACAQTHERTHVVIVDDGSTDGSREVLRGSGAASTRRSKSRAGRRRR